MLSLLSLFVSSVTFAPEWTAVPAAVINASAMAATSAFVAEDEGAFTTATNVLRRDLASAAPLTANDVAAIHLALALDALSPLDERALDAHLRAVLALRPTFAFTAKVAPPGGPLDRAMRAARGPLTHTPFPVGAPCSGKLPLTIDGEPATGWSGERAAIAQIDAPGSAPTVTILLLPGMHDPFAGVACPTGLDLSDFAPSGVGTLDVASSETVAFYASYPSQTPEEEERDWHKTRDLSVGRTTIHFRFLPDGGLGYSVARDPVIAITPEEDETEIE